MCLLLVVRTEEPVGMGLVEAMSGKRVMLNRYSLPTSVDYSCCIACGAE
jgi:hypothetical protein